MRQSWRLRVALAVQWGLGWAAAAAWLRLPGFLALLAAPILAALGVAAVLAIEFALGAALEAVPQRPRLAAIAAAWRSELGAHLRGFWWLQPFRAGDPSRRPASLTGLDAVLLVHGFGCNSAMWLPLLESGRLAGVAVGTVDLDPPCASIEEHAGRIDAAVRELKQRARAQRVCLLAHSMGGLAVLAYLRRYGDGSVGRIVALATPFAGTWAAHWLACPAARQMRPLDPWRVTLIGELSPDLRRRILCVASRQDNVVVPRQSAALPGAHVRWVESIGHFALSCDPAIWHLAIDYLRGDGESPGDV
jgi:pimeloyl-ACP methyl ester carboxylesterase